MADIMRGMMPQVEAAAMAQEMQEMSYSYSYMLPMPYMLQGNDCGSGSGGSTSEEGSTEDVPGSWGSLWNLDDVHAAAAQQDRAFSFY